MSVVKPALFLLGLFSVLAVAQAADTAKAASAATAQAPIAGKVLETMDAAGYTYFLVAAGERKVWVAATQVPLKVGDQVVVADAMAMTNYQSKTLKRTFDLVYFASGVTVNGRPAAASASTASAPLPAEPAMDLTGITRAPNGQTVAEIFAAGARLAGQKVTLRGRVVKYNGGILGKNWLHVRDGTGTAGANDLSVTTLATCRVGDLVTVTGVLAANRDFGGGYKYALIVEDATVQVETGKGKN